MIQGNTDDHDGIDNHDEDDEEGIPTQPSNQWKCSKRNGIEPGVD